MAFENKILHCLKWFKICIKVAIDCFSKLKKSFSGPLATGCAQVDLCANKQLYCDRVAICENQIPPEVGVNCICPSDHYGDG